MYRILLIIPLLVSACHYFDIISDCGTQITLTELSTKYFDINKVNDLENEVIEEWSNKSSEIFKREISKDEICSSLNDIRVNFVESDFVWYEDRPAKGVAYLSGDIFIATKAKNTDDIYPYIYKVYCHEISHSIFWDLNCTEDHHIYFADMFSCSEQVQ